MFAPDPSADTNEDGTVDIFDLAELANRWGASVSVQTLAVEEAGGTPNDDHLEYGMRMEDSYMSPVPVSRSEGEQEFLVRPAELAAPGASTCSLQRASVGLGLEPSGGSASSSAGVTALTEEVQADALLDILTTDELDILLPL